MDCINFSFEGENLCDISWATKNFACSFCKREFRSAQALGGHMNVHRRDRARLRLLPSTFSSEICPQNPNPNPNSYFSSSSSSSPTVKPCFPHNYSSWISPSMRNALVVSTPSSSSLISTANESHKKPKFDFFSSPQISHHAHPSFLPKKGKIFEGFAQIDDDEFNKDLDLDLEMGFFKDHKEEVDLELRLGHL